ncbi:MAG: hypothetical protein H6682_10165 [Candidatus Eisenbacteria bacterium]|nr:hypothetical protein [Candidatus Eisenbacteria bacterium]
MGVKAGYVENLGTDIGGGSVIHHVPHLKMVTPTLPWPLLGLVCAGDQMR